MHAEHPFGFTLTNSYYYFTDWFNKSVIRIPRHSNGNPEEVRHNLRGALEIRSVSIDRQPKYFNPCNESNGGCTHLCLYLGGTKYVCECPNNADSRSCKREIKQSAIKPPDNDDTTYTPSTTEGTIPMPKTNDSSLMLGIVIVMTLLLLLVVSTIICKAFIFLSFSVFTDYHIFSVLVCHSKKKEKNKARLTFSNPNYNGSGYNEEAHKSTFFKKFKYDKAQVCLHSCKV